MSSNSFFPTTEAKQIVWLGNYASKLPIHGPACGIRPEEITETLADLQGRSHMALLNIRWNTLRYFALRGLH